MVEGWDVGVWGEGASVRSDLTDVFQAWRCLLRALVGVLVKVVGSSGCAGEG